ncbi:MAG: ABC transporter substrate binding protein, partial [Xanthobacteraceae bacterium]
RVTTTIPIVQAVGSDLVAAGFAGSLARPGGNVTGSTFFFLELMAKRLELLKEILPSMTHAGVLVVRNHPSMPDILKTMGDTAQALNVSRLVSRTNSMGHYRLGPIGKPAAS